MGIFWDSVYMVIEDFHELRAEFRRNWTLFTFAVILANSIQFFSVFCDRFVELTYDVD